MAREADPGPMQENEVPLTMTASKATQGEGEPKEPQDLKETKLGQHRIRAGLAGLGGPSSSSGVGGSSHRISQSGFGSSLATPSVLGYRQRRLSDEACFVDEEFRTDLEPTRSRTPRQSPARDFVATTPPRRRYRAASPSSAESRAAPRSEGRLLQRNDTQGTQTSVDSHDSEKENKDPDDLQEATPEPMARVIRSPSWTPGRRTLELGNVLQELDLHVPEELMHQGQTPESPQSEESPVPANRQAQNQTPAEMLEERMANTSSRYDFEVYVDPENRQP